MVSSIYEAFHQKNESFAHLISASLASLLSGSADMFYKADISSENKQDSITV